MVDFAKKSNATEPTLADRARSAAKRERSKMTVGERLVLFVLRHGFFVGLVLVALAVVGVLFRLNVWLWIGR